MRDKVKILITNMKSYTGSRLPPNSVTLDDFERKIKVFNEIFGDFGLNDIFQ